MQTTKKLIDLVSEAHRRQWSVLPLNTNKKPPLKWKRYQTQRATTEEIANWNDCYQPGAWAVITGAISGIIVLDFDGEPGRKTLELLGLNPHVKTGSGGYHVYFQHPGWHVKTLNHETSQNRPWSKRYPGLDIRADGGYAAFCGSNSNGQYTWLREPIPDDLSILPDPLRDFLGLLHAPDADQPQKITSVQLNSPVAPSERLEDRLLNDTLSGIKGGRNDSGIWLACQLRDNNFSYSEAKSIMLNYQSRTRGTNAKGQQEDYTEREALASLDQAYNRPAREPWKTGPEMRQQDLEAEMMLLMAGQQYNTTIPSEEMEIDERKPGQIIPNPVSLERILKFLDQNELGDGLLFVESFQGQVLFDHTEKAWYLWHGHYWRQDSTGRIKHLVSGYLGSIYLHAQAELNKKLVQVEQEIAVQSAESLANKNIDKLKDEAKDVSSQMKALAARATSLRTAKRCANVQTFAQYGLAIEAGQWDSNHWLLGVQNGVIDLQTGNFRPGRPDDYIRTICSTAWSGIDTPCLRFEQFLEEIFQDKSTDDRQRLITFLHRLFGYSITGLTYEHVFPIFYGEEGRNGKSVLFKVLKYVLGAKIASAISNDVIISSDALRRAGSATPHITDLQGKRLVWASETKLGDRLNVAQIKNFTGGDPISARPLYGKQYTFDPTHTLFLLTNYKPHAEARDKAFWERACLIEFGIRFVDHPVAENERQKDGLLEDKLKAEASGILALLVRGCLEWQRIGLERPAIVIDSTQSYRTSEDLLQLFTEECCVVGEGRQAPAQRLYERYKEWCKDNTLSAMSGKLFGQEISKIYPKNSTKEGRIYQGIGLLSEIGGGSDLPFTTDKTAWGAERVHDTQDTGEGCEGYLHKVPYREVQKNESGILLANTLHTLHTNQHENSINQPVEPSHNGVKGRSDPPHRADMHLIPETSVNYPYDVQATMPDVSWTRLCKKCNQESQWLPWWDDEQKKWRPVGRCGVCNPILLKTHGRMEA